MYQIGEVVMHSFSGICKITDVKKMQFGKAPKRKYYVLVPIYTSANTIYVPTDNEDLMMRKPLEAKEIKKLISGMPSRDSQWIDDMKMRKENAVAIIRKGDPDELIDLIRATFLRGEERKSLGKRISEADEKQMQQAEKVLYEEFAYGLGIKPEEVVTLINKELAKEL